MNRSTMTPSAMQQMLAHSHGAALMDIPDSWFDTASHPDQDCAQSTDVSVSSASPTTVTSDCCTFGKVPEKPKRSLSAYNYFFQAQRQEILKTMPTRAEGKPRRSHGKIGFADLARLIASRWKSISQDKRDFYERLAADDKARYVREMEEWKAHQKSGTVSPMNNMRHDLKSHHLIQSKSFAADRVPSRAIPDLILMTQTPTAVPGDDFFTMIDKPLALDVVKADPRPQISDLAEKLDAESLEMLVNIFR